MYLCNLFFKNDPKILEAFLPVAMNSLGFAPQRMILVPGPESDISFEMSAINDLVKKGPRRIQLMNSSYGEIENYSWFRISIANFSPAIEFVWLNSNLDFLLKENNINNFLRSKEFICGHCLNNDDLYKQSKERTVDFINRDPNNPYDVEKIEKNLDVSKNWGRGKMAGGLLFSASPLSWYGENFFTIISYEKLLSFKYSSELKVAENRLIQIKLFDLYDSPEDEINRQKQKEYWNFFNLEEVARSYAAANEPDPKEVFKSLFKKG